MNIKINNQRGQGLLELVIAIGIIVTGLFAVWTLFLSNFAGEQESSFRITGANLAREGVEIVKNIRDSNWLKIEDNEMCGLPAVSCKWDGGLVTSPLIAETAVINTYIADEATLDFTPNLITDPEARLYINNTTGLYVKNPLDASPSAFSRLITLTELCCADATGDLKCDNTTFTPCGGADMAGKLNIAIDVQSQVEWSIKGKVRDIIVEDVLYNWK